MRRLLFRATLLLMPTTIWSSTAAGAAERPFVPPASPRIDYNMNFGWRFIRQDVPVAQDPSFDDSGWSPVSLPHNCNDIDTFNRIISHAHGQAGA